MSKITKKELRQRCIDNETAIARLESILKENGIERQPQLKHLDQSIFDGLDEKWRFAARSRSGKAIVTKCEPKIILNGYFCENGYLLVGAGYDTSNWQNSLIERESKELTGSDLCRAMLERGDKFILCSVDDCSDNDAINDLEVQVIVGTQLSDFISQEDNWKYAVPVNNQGEPLTASEVGL